MLNATFPLYSGLNEDHIHALRDTAPCVIGWSKNTYISKLVHFLFLVTNFKGWRLGKRAVLPSCARDAAMQVVEIFSKNSRRL